MTATANSIFTTADIEGLADLIAFAKEELGLDDLHPNVAARYRGIAAGLASEGIERTPKAIAEFIALVVEDTGHLNQVAPWVFVRYLDTADDILKEF
ncbi:hypothetical protein ACIQZO_35125 [Streptomyces sp. NPDC097617]|uniref:hypothetical protein n=1 Tax=Streptomyces sp. NPDC097617 TaxID=3366091 RepID=UPI0037F3C614